MLQACKPLSSAAAGSFVMWSPAPAIGADAPAILQRRAQLPHILEIIRGIGEHFGRLPRQLEQPAAWQVRLLPGWRHIPE